MTTPQQPPGPADHPGSDPTGMSALFNLLNPGQMITMHVVLFPALVLAIVAGHLLFVRKHGITPPYDAREEHLAPLKVTK